MDYIAITFLSIVVSIFFAFKILGRLGLDLNIKPLVLCALCALAINFCLPVITAHLAQYHLAVILGITITASYFISRYNAKLTLHRQTVENLVLEQDDNVAPAAIETMPEKTKAVASKKIEIKIAEIVKPVSAPIITEVKNMGAKQKTEPAAVFASAAKQQPNLNTAVLAAANTAVETAQPKQLPNKPPLYLVKNDLCKIPALPKPEIKAEVKPEVAAELPAPVLPKIEAKVIDLAKEAKKQKKLAIINHVAKLEQLDDLLDYALAERDKDEKDSALYAFKKALKLYQKNDYAPFIVIEIGNIYKNTGLYDDAIVIYNKALKLPALVHNDELRQEFINNIAYLRIVKNALLRRNITRTPFKDISQKIFSEIEAEFQNWRTQNL